MLSDEQIKKLISANESLQVQLDEVNRILVSREAEIALLNEELAASTALRSKLDAQSAEIESIHNLLDEKQHAVIGAGERALELHRELGELALLNKEHDELIQDYAWLQSRYKDLQQRNNELEQQCSALEKTAGSIGELQSRLENSLLENKALRDKINALEALKSLREI